MHCTAYEHIVVTYNQYTDYGGLSSESIQIRYGPFKQRAQYPRRIWAYSLYATGIVSHCPVGL